jgi:hypothetical protein
MRGCGDAKSLSRCDGDDEFLGEHGDRRAQRDVHRDRDDAQGGGGEHHHRMADTGEGGEEFGVAGIGKTGLIQDRLADRVGDDAVDVSGEREAGCAFDGDDHAGGVCGIGVAWNNRRGERDAQHWNGGWEDRTRLGHGEDFLDRHFRYCCQPFRDIERDEGAVGFG